MELAKLLLAVDARQVKDGEKALSGLEKSAVSTEKAAGKLGAAIGTAVAALSISAVTDWVKATADGVAQIEKMARLSGASAEQFQKVAFGAARFGVEAEKLSDILKDVQDKVGDFTSGGGGELKDFFENIAPKVGVTAEQFKELSGPDALGLYVQSLQKAGVTQSEMVFYLEAIANDASLLAPLFADNSAALNEYASQAERLGLILSTETIAQAKEFQVSLSTLDAITGNISQRVAAEMLPTMNDLTGTLIDVAAETDLVSNTVDTLSGTLKGLTSVAIGISEVFSLVGNTLGATAAALVAAAQGEFSQAYDIIKMASEDNEASLLASGERINNLWNGQAAKITETANATSQALGKVSTASRQAGESVKQASGALDGQIESLRIQAETLGMSTREATLYNLALDGATASQIANADASLAQIEAFAAVQKAQQEARKAEEDAQRQKQSQTTLLGQVDPMVGEQQRFQRELENLRMLNDAKLLEDQRYLDLKAQAETQHEQNMQLMREENFARQSAANGLLIESLNQLQAGATQAFVGLLTGANNSEEAVRQLAGSILNEAVGALVQMGVQYLKNLVIGEAAQAATAASGAATAAALSAAYATPAALASLASFGANAAPAATGIASTVGLAQGLALTSFEGGGFTGTGSRSGGMDGKGGFLAMVHPNETVIDHTKGQSGGGANVTVNVIESSEKAGQQERKTNADGSESVDVFVADIYGDGPRSKAIQNAFGLQRAGR